MRSRARSVMSVVGLVPLLSCQVETLAGAGQACESSADCSEPLDCIESICVDDTGPHLAIAWPRQLDAFVGGELIYVGMGADAEIGGYELIFDPYGPDPTIVTSPGASLPLGGLPIAAPLQPGGHWLRARALDEEGEAYENPGATTEVLVFVRDDVHPDKPLVALIEPRPDHVHALGHDLGYEAAVLPGSFAFTQYADHPCEPLPACADPFAPECEDTCGPVSRFGGLFAYLDQDLPACTLLEPSCAFAYVSRYDEQIDAYVVRGTIAAPAFEAAGEHTLALMLSYRYGAYPSDAAPIFVEQPLRVE